VGGLTVDQVFVADGGGSKTDVALLGADGSLLAKQRLPAYPPHRVGTVQTMAALDAAVRDMQAGTGTAGAAVAMTALCFADLDWDFEKTEFFDAARRYAWAQQGLMVDTDTFPLLRAGTDQATAIAVVCGTGMNCVGRAADGSTAWFPAIGEISGDWGGGWTLGMEAIWHAARASDGRGPATVLQQLTPAALGCTSMDQVILGFHTDKLDEGVIRQLAPVIFQAVEAGDEVAMGVVDRQADEIVAYASAALKQLGVVGQRVPIVLGGGVIAARHDCLLRAIDAKLAERVPPAYSVIVTDPPVLGAGLLAFDALGATPEVLARVRQSLSL